MTTLAGFGFSFIFMGLGIWQLWPNARMLSLFLVAGGAYMAGRGY